jgi:hypothetical protein
MDHAELASLLDSFTLHLRGARKSAETVRTYGNGVRTFLAWCQWENIEPGRWASARSRRGRCSRTAGPRWSCAPASHA